MGSNFFFIKLIWIYNVLCSNLDSLPFRNEDCYLKVHYDMDILPEDCSTLPKSNSHVCKWHLFVSNITEDVFHVLKDTFTLDYTHTLISKCSSMNQTLPLLSHYNFQPLLQMIPSKVSFCFPLIKMWYIFMKALTISFLFMNGAYQKLDAISKGIQSDKFSVVRFF